MLRDNEHPDKYTQQSGVWSGIYRGVVEYINDPLMQNRIKVRVPAINKTVDVVSTEALPWAVLMTSFGGAGGFGIVAVPPVGSTVFVEYEGGNPAYPVVVGTWFGVPSIPQPMGRINEQPKGKISMSPDESSPWHTEPGPEIPDDSQRRANLAPENYVFKTPKGHTLIMEDRDEAEYFAIIDRAGQTLLFESEVLESENIDNAARRGLKRASENDGLDVPSQMLGSSSKIEITDAAGNTVRLYAKKDSERVILTSVTDENTLIFDLRAADGTIDLRGDSTEGETRIGLDAVTGSAFMRSRTGNELRVDSHGGVSIKSDTLTVEGDLSVSGAVSAAGGVTSSGAQGGSPGSFNPIAMPIPPPGPPPPGEADIEAIITERYRFEDTVNEEGYVLPLDYTVFFHTPHFTLENPPVVLSRNGVTQAFNHSATMFTDFNGNLFDTQGASVVDPQTGPGTGLRIEWYNDDTFTLLAEIDLIGPVNYSFASPPYPVTGITSDVWSARLTGFVKPQYQETYTITATAGANDLVRIWIDGVELALSSGPVFVGTFIAPDSGVKLPIKVEHRNVSGTGALLLQWQSTSLALETIPLLRMYTEGSSETVVRDPAFGYSFDGTDCWVGAFPGYHDVQIGHLVVGVSTGYTRDPTYFPNDTQISYNPISNTYLGVERLNHNDGTQDPNWTLVLRGGALFTIIATNAASFFGANSAALEVYVSNDPDGSFWVSLPSAGALWNISPTDASVISEVIIGSTLAAKRLQMTPLDTQYYLLTDNQHIRTTKRMSVDEFFDVTYAIKVGTATGVIS